MKLHHYGNRGYLLDWFRNVLTQQHQQLVLEGAQSGKVKVISGVPQGTVLGPLLFLLYINDLPKCVTSTTRLFADDCIMYRNISSPVDLNTLQQDLDALSSWHGDGRCLSTPRNASPCTSRTNAYSSQPNIGSVAKSSKKWTIILI